MNWYMKNEDTRSITWFTKLSDCRGFFKHPCLCLSFFCCWLRFNRQVSLLLFHLKLPFFASLASNSSKDHQQKNEATFLYHGFSKEAWVSSHSWIYHWQPFVVSKTAWLLWWAPSARPKVPEAVRQDLESREWAQLTMAPSLLLWATSLCSRATHSFSLRKEKPVSSSSFPSGFPWGQHSCTSLG